MQIYKEKPNRGERTKIGEKTLPQLPQQSHENAALAAFSRLGYGQVATPSGVRLLDLRFPFISSSGFPVSAPGFDEAVFDLWL